MTAAKTPERITLHLDEEGHIGRADQSPGYEYILTSVVEKRERALREALSGALDVIDHGVPESCGACGTPNATCDGDCVAAAYLASDQRKWRALAAADEGKAVPCGDKWGPRLVCCRPKGHPASVLHQDERGELQW